jgi:cbb3-type cytochrome oxidase cytochrome c subunit
MPRAGYLAWRACCAVIVFVLIWPSAVCADDDSDYAPLPPGLHARYFASAAQAAPLLERVDALPALLLSAEEAPDSRLPADGWSVRWQGLLDIQQPGKYRFSAIATGALRVTVADQFVIEEQNAAGEISPGREISLAIGTHPIGIEFRPPAGQKRLKLFWQSEYFAREPIPAHVLGRDSGSPLDEDRYLAGRLAVEEHSCVACHRASDTVPLSGQLLRRPGPRLKEAGARLHAAWVYHWLGDPSAFRPEAVMPRLFGADRRGEVERFVVAQFLTGDDSPAANVPPAAEQARLFQSGQTLFQRSGCVVCHERQISTAEAEIAPRATLKGLAQKTSIDRLAALIEDPYHVDPAGRMPKLGLGKEDCLALAVYLTQRDAASVEQLAMPAPPTQEELEEAFAWLREDGHEQRAYRALDRASQIERLAREVIRARRCANCHDFGDDADEMLKPQLADRDFAGIAGALDRGCLAPHREAAIPSVPNFGPSLDHVAARAFLEAAVRAPATRSPVEFAQLTLARFNCTGCHPRHGRGGLSATQMELLTENQTVAEAELVRPPTLTGISGKLRAASLRAILAEGQRSRPWMALKMPHFQKQDVAQLAEALAAAEGDALVADQPAINPQPDLAEAGRALVGAKGFGCIKCHDIRGIASTGTRGPDLAEVASRIHFDWYVRWMTDPQRIEPGTRMPTVFFGGQSPYKDILDGDPSRQTLAIWHYLSAGEKLELPEGLEPTKIRESIESSRPLVMRTFLPELSPRSLGIRFGNGVHLAFDGGCCRLAYAWQGGFLDLGPVWSGRGGRPAEIEGEIFWRAPAGFPWAVRPISPGLIPDFAAQANDPAFGAPPPDEGRIYKSRVHFRGYRLGARGPTFRYELEPDEGGIVRFEESVASLTMSDGVGILRSIVIHASSGTSAWLRVAEGEPPAIVRTDGSLALVDPSASPWAASTAVAVQHAGKPLIVRVLSGSTKTLQWVATKQYEQWQLMLRAPSTTSDAPLELTVVVVQPKDNKPETIARLLRQPIELTLLHPGVGDR